MRVQLRDLTPGTEYAITFRSNNGEEVSEWSPVQRFTTTNDTVPPAPVTNLTWGQSGRSFVATWDRPTLDAQGKPLLDFRDFQVEIDDTVNIFKHIVHTVDRMFVFSEDEHVKAFGSRKNSLRITVKVRDLAYNESTSVILTSSLDTPPVPSTPTIGNYLGMLNVTWDGKATGGTAMPENFSHVEVHVSTTNNFTPSDSTFKTRIVADGSASSAVIPGLAFDALVYVRLVAVSKLNKKSGPSAQVSGTPTRVSGLDIKNGTLTKDQINFTAAQIGGANAFYQASQPTSGMVAGDLWYDTDDQYEVYRYTGSAWVLAPEVGQVYGKKIITGALTGDKIATNFFAAALARIGSAYIDSAMIQTVSAASITTGSLQANQRIIAGPELENHAEMTSGGFYVKGPQPGTLQGQPPVIVDRIRMGTGLSDFFAIPDPADPETTLAQIDENGRASFQGLYVQEDPVIKGKNLTQIIEDKGGGLVGRALIVVTGLQNAGSAGIRGEYGIGQFSFDVKPYHTYRIFSRLQSWFITNGGEAWTYMRVQKDLRTSAEKTAGVLPTPVTNSSTNFYSHPRSGMVNSYYQVPLDEGYYINDDYEGTVTVGLSMLLSWPAGSDSVLKVTEGAHLNMFAFDMGPNQTVPGRMHNQGGTLYAIPTPAPPPATAQRYGEWRYNWVRSYQGNNVLMANSSGRAYQGQDPSGYNGNMMSYYGFGHADFRTLGQIDRIVVYLYFGHWYYNAGGTARIGYHNVWGDPGAGNRIGTILGTFDSAGWPKPGSRELDLTGWKTEFLNGNFRGIALGPGNNSYQNYGYATDCVLKIWYTN